MNISKSALKTLVKNISKSANLKAIWLETFGTVFL